MKRFKFDEQDDAPYTKKSFRIMEEPKFRSIGLDIHFPFDLYPIQKTMVGRLITAYTNQYHCLLESPTGTGKTLVLLCSALAWREKSKSMGQPYRSPALIAQLAEERRKVLEKKHCKCGRRQTRNELDELKDMIDPKKPKNKKVCDVGDEDPDCIVIPDDDDDDCKIISNGDNCYEKSVCDADSTKFSDDLDDCKKPSTIDSTPCESCQALAAHELLDNTLGQPFLGVEQKKIPRIYYGTRTHKQITQVVRELNKTPYRSNLRMCILSSRERTCINESVKDESNRNDLCQELVRNKQASASGKKKKAATGESCPYYSDSNTIAAAFEQINLDYDTKAWDIEDASAFGTTYGCCPYFGLRSLQEQADITFSPYNYLLDPMIRKTLDIKLKNSIVILDEAHNIEDICRDSASFVIDSDQIEGLLGTVTSACSFYLQGSAVMNGYQLFKSKLTDLLLYLKNYSFDGCLEQSGTDNKVEKIFNQHEMRQQLELIGFGASDHKEIVEALKAIMGDDEESEDKSRNTDSKDNLNSSQLQFLKQLVNTLNFMYSDNQKYYDDFRFVIDRTNGFNMFKKNRSRGGFNKPSETRATQPEKDTRVWKFSLLCMNPGVAFEYVHSSAWSVVVASGTLSPIDSLKTELGCKFGVVFEGSHVIAADRVFASILSKGPTGLDLNCSWANSTKTPFQFEVGAIVRDVCNTVPNGVVVFFPSYDRMENFYQQWFMKGYIDEIKRSGKRLFRENNNQTPAKFETELENYNKHAKMSGAILFAVFRGKVSEGIDFADKAARAVITIGIPYPNIKEVTIGLKKAYNDTVRSTKPHLMTGGDWYSSQAFRALNQALGRCIRHKDDWGAVIMIDSRLENSWCSNSISKWIRKLMLKTNSYSQTYAGLKEFVQARAESEDAK